MTDYRDILNLIGYPTDVLVLDWECYFDKDYSLSKKDFTDVQFVEDERFEIIGLGIRHLRSHDRDSGAIFHTAAENAALTLSNMQVMYGPNLERCTVVAHNASFDCLILAEKFGIVPRYTIDTIDLSRHLDARGRHDLKHLAKKYGAPKPKGDTNQFKGLHADDLTPEQWAAMSEYCCTDIDITSFLFQTLLPRITRPEVELPLATQTLRRFLIPDLVVDLNLGHRLEQAMVGEVDAAVTALHKYDLWVEKPATITKKRCIPPTVRRPRPEDISSKTEFAKILQAAMPDGESIPMKPDKNGKPIPALAKTDDACIRLLQHPSQLVRDVVGAKRAVQSWSGHISRVRRLLAVGQCRGGRLGIPLRYYGGHTGRDSGTGGINVQNFGARNVHPLIKQVGTMLMPKPGYLFGTGDLSQIEARKIAWLAGQEDLVEQFRKGEDIYSDFAQNQIFHEETRKPREGDSPELAKALTIRRDFGKEVILACGFGMGGTTFYQRCLQNDNLRPLFEAGTYDEGFCQRLVKLYRNRYQKIVSYWRELEAAFRFVTKYNDQSSTVTHNGRSVTFYSDGDTTAMLLPSGRCMFYPHARVGADGQLSYTSGGTKYYLYGGKLAENLTQASARDVFMDGVLRLEEAGIPVLFRIHDAAITLIPDDDDTAGGRLAEMHRLQTIVPDWCPGLPVATEGKLCRRFEK